MRLKRIRNRKIVYRWIAIIVLLMVCLSCSRELSLTPPAGVKILTFEQNVYAKNRAIYQTNADGEFKVSETTHTWWGGIVTPEVSHRLHANLMANIPEIYFIVTFPKSGKKTYCASNKDKNIAGCAISAVELKENEFLIEVFAPKGLSKDKKLMYRLFVGIEGPKQINFFTLK